MKTLSYTQEYFLCAVNNKGKISSSTWKIVLITSAITELISHEYIIYAEKDKLVTDKAWDDSLPYLKSLYETIVTLKKPLTISGVVRNYSEKQLNALFSEIGDSLVGLGYADRLSKQGLIKEKITYVPKEDAVKSIVEKVRAEFLDSGTMTHETICLTALLDIDGLIRNYFSKFEAKFFNTRIKDVRKSEMYVSIKEILDEISLEIVVISVVT